MDLENRFYQLLEIFFWAVLLPFVGFCVISLRLAGLPIFVFILAPFEIFVRILEGGFLPSIVPAAVFVLLRERLGTSKAMLAAMAASAGAATIWLGLIVPGELDSGLLSIWFLLAAVLSPLIMLLSAWRENE